MNGWCGMRGIFGTSAVVLAAASSAAWGAVSFRGLGELPGAPYSSLAVAVSGDGSVAVGYGISGASGPAYQDGEGFRWTAAGGLQGLGERSSNAGDVSEDGLVVVGFCHYHWPAQVYDAYRWTEAGGMQILPVLPGASSASACGACGVSRDGSVVVGSSDSASGHEACRWTGGGVSVQGLGDLPGGGFYSHAEEVSADGSVVVGYGTSASGKEAFRWTADGGMQGLGGLAGGTSDSYAYGVSADASVIVGQGWSAAGGRAFRWTASGGMEALDSSGYTETSAWAASGDGSTIVGRGTYNGNSYALIWDASHGLRDLRWALIDDYGYPMFLALNGWKLGNAADISPDGRTIVGWGINPSGQQEAFVVTVPEPATASLLLLATAGLLGRRRR